MTKHSNTVLKIISLILAIVLWAYVAYQDSPEISHWFNGIPVTIVGADKLDSEGYYVIGANLSSVNVKLRGDRNALSKVELSDITVQLDVSDIRQEGSIPSRCKISVDSNDVSVVSSKPDIVTVSVEKIITDVIPIKVKLVGSPAEGYSVFDEVISSDGTVIKGVSVRGAKSVISSVDSISTKSVSVEGKSQSGSVSVGLTAYDVDGNSLSGVTFEPAMVDVSYTVLREKTVPLNIALTNVPIDKEITCSPNTIKVYGSDDVLSGIESISSLPLDVSGANDGDRYSAQLNIPAGARLNTNDSIADITVSVKSLDENTNEDNSDAGNK